MDEEKLDEEKNEEKTFVMPEQPSLTDKDKERIMAAMSYIGILFVVPLFLVRRKSQFLTFHLRQGMVLFFIEAIFTAIPVLGWMMLFLPIVASIYGMLQAYMGREWELPFIAKYARRINL